MGESEKQWNFSIRQRMAAPAEKTETAICPSPLMLAVRARFPPFWGCGFLCDECGTKPQPGRPLQGRRGSFLLCILQMAGCGCILWERFEQT